MESLVNCILCRSTRCSSVQNTYILSTQPGWLGGMLILMTKSPIESPYAGFIWWFRHKNEYTDHNSYTTSCDKTQKKINESKLKLK